MCYFKFTSSPLLLPLSVPQDMHGVVLLAIERAASPTEVIEALLTLQTMLIGDAVAQVIVSYCE